MLWGLAFRPWLVALAEPAMNPAVVAADAASSGSDSWVAVIMTRLVFGVAIAN